MFALLLCACALLVSVAGCVPAHGTTTPEAVVRARPAPARIVQTSTGRGVSFDEMMAELRDTQVVYVAERHDEPLDHAAQYAILRALAADSGATVLGMEMFQTPYQEPLDSWGAGDLDEPAMLEATDYAHRWGYDIGLYRPMLDFARSHHVRVRALNAPSELSRAVAREGLEGLDPAARETLPEIDLEVPGHRAMVQAELREHPHMSDAKLERFYEAQVVWDETMAAGVAAALEGAPAPARVMVMAGRMHVERGLGIPVRAQRRGVERQRLVVPIDADELEAALGGATGSPWGDYLWVNTTRP